MRITSRTVLQLLSIAALSAAACGGDSAAVDCPASCPESSHCDSATRACVCDDNFYGEPGACEKTSTCFSGLCRRGTCDDSSGVAVCTCFPHATGDKCDGCDDGYLGYMDGCIANPCTATTCGDLMTGSCSVGPGPAAVCTCNAGYTGDRCERCADDYVQLSDAPLRCVLNPCKETTCNGHGTCSMGAGGFADCACEAGWRRPACKYHSIDGCQLVAPTALSIPVGGSFQVVADLFVDGFTVAPGALEGIRAQVCFAHPSVALNPNSSVNLGQLLCWPAATFLEDVGDKDRYVARSDSSDAKPELQVTNGASTTYQYVFGFSSDDGASWTVCDTNGISVESVSPGTVTVNP